MKKLKFFATVFLITLLALIFFDGVALKEAIIMSVVGTAFIFSIFIAWKLITNKFVLTVVFSLLAIGFLKFSLL